MRAGLDPERRAGQFLRGTRRLAPPLGRTNTIRIPKYCASFLTYFHKVEELGATSAKESEATAGRLSV
jgi:hypothetical protein